MYKEAASKIIKIETERADLFDVSILIAMRIHISGNVTATEISEAFDVAVYANEILQSHVVVDPRGKAYYDVNGFSNSSIEFEDNDWRTILRREEKKLDVWTHNKAIQKSVESYRITDEQKAYLKTLKIK